MPETGKNKRYLRLLRIYSLIYLLVTISVPIVITVLIIAGFKPLVESNESKLLIVSSLFLFSIIGLILGFYLPHLLKRIGQKGPVEQSLVFVHVMRLSLFLIVAVFGLLIFIAGGSFITFAILIINSIVGLIYVHPTEEKWEKDWRT